MGYKILSDRAKSGFGGYLCNVPPADYLRLTQNEPLPEVLTGTEFLMRHGGIFDTATMIRPEATYPVRAATEHPIYENERVHRFVELLRADDDSAFVEAGEIMLAAHRSYSRCGLGTTATDLLVEQAQALGGTSVAGAKITGGGSGGTVCVLCKKADEEQIVQSVSAAYAARTGTQPRVIRGTSSGAWATPIRELSSLR